MADGSPAAARRLVFLKRFGDLARGLVYVAIGITAARAAFTPGLRATGPGGALHAILRGPHGRIIVAAVAAGLFADAFFRAIEAVAGRGFLFRVSRAARALGALALGWTALRVERIVRSRHDGNSFRDAVAWLLQRRWGPRALVAAGAVAAFVAVLEIVQAVSRRFRARFRRKDLPRFSRDWVERVMRFGLGAHGALVGVMAWYLWRAGIESNARDVADSGTALRRVQHLPFGTGLLAAIAVGLVAYGVSQWVLAISGKRGT